MRGDSTDLIDVYRTKWQEGSEVLSYVGDLMWDCGKAAAADHFNCMDKSRGFGGYQFERQPQLFPRADWVRNCFNCGQPRHLARECPQNLVRRGVGLQFDFLGRGVPQRGWPISRKSGRSFFVFVQTFCFITIFSWRILNLLFFIFSNLLCYADIHFGKERNCGTGVQQSQVRPIMQEHVPCAW